MVGSNQDIHASDINTHMGHTVYTWAPPDPQSLVFDSSIQITHCPGSSGHPRARPSASGFQDTSIGHRSSAASMSSNDRCPADPGAAPAYRPAIALSDTGHPPSGLLGQRSRLLRMWVSLESWGSRSTVLRTNDTRRPHVEIDGCPPSRPRTPARGRCPLLACDHPHPFADADATSMIGAVLQFPAPRTQDTRPARPLQHPNSRTPIDPPLISIQDVIDGCPAVLDPAPPIKDARPRILGHPSSWLLGQHSGRLRTMGVPRILEPPGQLTGVLF